jgi:hypothetical protein
MTEDRFAKTLREFIHRQPFRPFVVELADGEKIYVDYPSVAFSGCAAGFLSKDDGMIPFSCDQVRSISLATPETSA